MLSGDVHGHPGWNLMELHLPLDFTDFQRGWFDAFEFHLVLWLSDFIPIPNAMVRVVFSCVSFVNDHG